MFLTRSVPDFTLGIGVHRRDAKPNDQIGPSEKRIGGHEPRCNDGDVCQDIIIELTETPLASDCRYVPSNVT